MKLLIELSRKKVVDPVCSVRPLVKLSEPTALYPGASVPPLVIVVAPPMLPFPPSVPEFVTITVEVPKAVLLLARRIPALTVVRPEKPLLFPLMIVVPLPS